MISERGVFLTLAVLRSRAVTFHTQNTQHAQLIALIHRNAKMISIENGLCAP